MFVKWTLCAGVALASLAWAQGGSPPEHVLLTAKEIKWGACPPALRPAPGLQCAVLAGDPGKAGGHFVIRLNAPNGYTIPPHFHPVTEHVTVISGTFMLGMGEKLDKAHSRALGPGGFAMLPAQMRHFAWMKGNVVADVYGVGPFEITFVNPADDPRKQTSTR